MNTEVKNNPSAPSPDISKSISQKPSGTAKKLSPLYPFMAVGSLIYAFFYTFCLYANHSGITYPFFVGGTCAFFFCYLQRCGITAGKNTRFLTISIILLGISTCMTTSEVLIFLNKLVIFFLFFYMALQSLYKTEKWNLGNWFLNIMNTVFSSLEYLPFPFFDFSAYRREKRSMQENTRRKGKYVFYGLLLSLPMLWITLLLLGSADAVFQDILNRMFSFDIDDGLLNHILKAAGLFAFAFFSSYCLLHRFEKRNLKEEISDKQTGEPIMAITFTGILSLIYALFCFVQIVYLFGGMGTLPKDYSYSDYAREGFFQLVFICILNLGLVLICQKYFRKNRILDLLLTFICGCTYIMIASSTYRMFLYIQAYHLTFLRVFVLWALLVITLLVTGALILIHKEDFPLIKCYVLTVTALYLLFSFAKPDYWIARYNFAHAFPAMTDENGNIYYDTNMSEFHYITGLSMDVEPAILDKMQEMEANAVGYPEWLHKFRRAYTYHYMYTVRYSPGYDSEADIVAYPLPEKQSLRTFNFSRWMAYRSLEEYYDTHPGFLNVQYD